MAEEVFKLKSKETCNGCARLNFALHSCNSPKAPALNSYLSTYTNSEGYIACIPGSWCAGTLKEERGKKVTKLEETE